MPSPSMSGQGSEVGWGKEGEWLELASKLAPMLLEGSEVGWGKESLWDDAPFSPERHRRRPLAPETAVMSPGRALTRSGMPSPSRSAVTCQLPARRQTSGEYMRS